MAPAGKSGSVSTEVWICTCAQMKSSRNQTQIRLGTQSQIHSSSGPDYGTSDLKNFLDRAIDHELKCIKRDCLQALII